MDGGASLIRGECFGAFWGGGGFWRAPRATPAWQQLDEVMRTNRLLPAARTGHDDGFTPRISTSPRSFIKSQLKLPSWNPQSLFFYLIWLSWLYIWNQEQQRKKKKDAELLQTFAFANFMDFFNADSMLLFTWIRLSRPFVLTRIKSVWKCPTSTTGAKSARDAVTTCGSTSIMTTRSLCLLRDSRRTDVSCAFLFVPTHYTFTVYGFMHHVTRHLFGLFSFPLSQENNHAT